MRKKTEKKTERLLTGADEIKVRLYGQGLGDCFLLAFPRTGEDGGKDPFYLVIDCGAATSTPRRVERTKRIVQDIRAATGGHIDALAITHQHFDHISGFQDAWQEWRQITVEMLYLPWTEADADNGEHKTATAFRKVLNRAAQKALERATEMGVIDAYPSLQAEADFLGVSALRSAEDGTFEIPKDMESTMDFIRTLSGGKVRYFAPGDAFCLPGTDFHGYVLGPPLPDTVRPSDNKRYVELLVDEDAMYSYHPLNMKVDKGKPGGAHSFALSDDHGMPALASGLSAVGGLSDPQSRFDDEGFCPFAPDIRLPWDYAMAAPFFQTYYSEEIELGENGAWRRVDTDWLGGAASLALRAGGFTNNVSLVLAFGFPKSEKILLFPGDAQVGNWLSWHTIKAWDFGSDPVPENPPQANNRQTLMENLLGRVAFYKVGHHGSHNATVSGQGLEKMTRHDLVAYIPVSVPVAQDNMGYCPMPFYPVLRALQKRTQGRVFLANGQAIAPTPEEKTNDALLKEAGIVRSSEELPIDFGGTVKDPATGKSVPLRDAIPLYLEATIAGKPAEKPGT